MNKRYIILIDEDYPSDVRNNITKFCKEQQFGYWHWIGNVWLVTVKNTWTSKRLRDEIKKMIPNEGLLVVLNATESSGWATYGNSKKSKWLKEYWHKNKL